jgi:hypothetical protein
MTPLRQRMIEDMQARNLAPHTQSTYLQYVAQFARHFRKSPELLGPTDIRAFQLYLARDRRLAAGSIGVALAGIRFLYNVTLNPHPVEERPMTPLRQRMIEDMQVRNLAPHTQRAYLQYVAQFAGHFRKSPELLGPTRDPGLSALSGHRQKTCPQFDRCGGRRHSLSLQRHTAARMERR